MKDNYQANKEQICEYQKKYRQVNKELISERAKESYEAKKVNQ